MLCHCHENELLIPYRRFYLSLHLRNEHIFEALHVLGEILSATSSTIRFYSSPACTDLQGRGDGEKRVCPAHVQLSALLAALFSEKVRNMSPDEIRIPPEPPGRCSSQLQVNTPPQLQDCAAAPPWAPSGCWWKRPAFGYEWRRLFGFGNLEDSSSS